MDESNGTTVTDFTTIMINIIGNNNNGIINILSGMQMRPVGHKTRCSTYIFNKSG